MATTIPKLKSFSQLGFFFLIESLALHHHWLVLSQLVPAVKSHSSVAGIVDNWLVTSPIHLNKQRMQPSRNIASTPSTCSFLHCLSCNNHQPAALKTSRNLFPCVVHWCGTIISIVPQTMSYNRSHRKLSFGVFLVMRSHPSTSTP